MTVSTTDSVIEYVSGGPAFPIPYRFLQNSDIQAVLVKQDGTSETLALGSQYTLVGAGTQSGGTLTSSYAAGYLATAGASLTISRVMSATQPTDLRNQGRFLAETHETVFDRLTMLIQQGFSILRRALLRPIGKNYYDAEGRQIKNLGDGQTDLDAVNVRTMRGYVDAAVAGVVGGFGWFIQAGAGMVYRTFQSKMRETVSVDDAGAVGDGITDSTAAINAAALALFNAGGGKLEFPGRKYLVSAPIIVYSNVHYVGKGRGATTIQAIPGSNSDIFKTKDFDALTGGGNISDAPYAFSIKDMTLDGNYLDLTGGLTWRTSDTVLNSAGSAIKIYGSRYDLDVEVYNVADNALYSEGGGNFIENQEHASRIHLTGRISGQEGIVFRGPGDINMQYVIFGLCGHLPLTQRTTASASPSKLYPGMNCVGLMLDNVSPFTGHVELGMVHIYAVSYNYGVYTRGVNRFNARHVVSENSLGGFYFGDGAHGVGSIIEARANGRMPDSYTGSSITQLKDVDLANGTIWNLNLVIKSYRYSPSRDFSGFLVDISGSNNNVRCAIFSQLQGAPTNKPLQGNALRVAGNNNNVDLTAQRINGNLLHVTGNYNNIRGACVSLYSGTAFIREAGFANNVDLTVGQMTADCVGFNSIGTVATEQINLNLSGTAGYTPFTGDPMAALNRACVWQIAASNGNTLNGKTTEDYIEVNIPTDTVSGTITVDHNFLYAPNRTQVSLSLNFPGTAPNQLLYVGVQGSPTATQVVITYRWAALPTSGGANVQIHIR